MQNYIYKILKEPIPQIYKLLEETIYGTKGIKVSHRDTEKKLSQLYQPDFHTLWKGSQVLAVSSSCVLSWDATLAALGQKYAAQVIMSEPFFISQACDSEGPVV